MDVADYLSVLRRRWLAVVVCLLAGLAGALALTRATDETYRSSARLFVNVPATRSVQEAVQGVQLTSGLLRSYAEVATSRLAAQRIVDELELEQSAGALAGQLRAVPTEETLLITISADDVDPAHATRLANAAADVFIGLVEDLESERAERTEARVIDGATEPVDPISPRPRRNAVAGLGLGLAVGLGLAFLLEALDRTVKSPQQASVAVQRPVLATVPRRRRGDELITNAPPGDNTAEAYRSLRTSIRFLGLDRPARSILVTSPGPQDGKTATAANLAVALAQGGERAVLVDADLRRGRLATLFELDDRLGLTSVVLGDTDLGGALQPWGNRLHVIPAGPHPPNPAEIIGSAAMAAMLTQLEGMADVVVIDAPPVLPVADAVALATQVDAVVLVVRAGRTRRDASEEARRRLEVVGAPLIGCVLNSVAGGGPGYRNEYRYNSRRQRRRRDAVAAPRT